MEIVKSNCFAKQAYDAKKWAFVSDYIRLYALYHEGGIYLDTDVEVLKNLDFFLNHSAFSGFETVDRIPTGIIGAKKGHPWIRETLEYYNNRDFRLDNGKYDTTPNVIIISEISKKFGFKEGDYYQVLENDLHIYPKEYFCPFHPSGNNNLITNNTYTIHHFAGSWVPVRKKIERKVRVFVKERLKLK